MIFAADLIRHLPVVMRIHLLGISSYGRAATRSQGPGRLGAPTQSFAGHNILLVDDVLDSGRTLRATCELFRAAGARQVRTCVLLCKPITRRAAGGLARTDYTGFDIPDEFVVGYGLDYDDYYRNLADIVVLDSTAMTGQDKAISGAMDEPDG